MSDGLIKALSDLEDVRAEAPEPKTDSVIERMEKVCFSPQRGIFEEQPEYTL